MSNAHGYDVNLVKPLSEGYKCPYCGLLMREPIQTIYGERSCRECYVSVVGTDALDSTQVFNDRLAQREIRNLECYCSNRNNGCKWIGVVQEVEAHSESCMYQTVACNLCGDQIILQELQEHKAESCRFRIVICIHCKEEISANRQDEHVRWCLKKPFNCPFKCGELILPENLASHAMECDVVLNGKTCPFRLIGCETVISSPEEQLNHVTNYVLNHHSNLSTQLDIIGRKTLVLTDQMNSVDRSIADLENKYVEVCKQKDALSNELDKYKSNFHVLESTYSKYREEMEKRITHLEDVTTFRNVKGVDEALKKNREEIMLLANQLKELGDIVQGNSSKDDMMLMKGLEAKVKGNAKQIDHIERDHAMMSATLSDLDLKVQLLETSSYDGHQIWRIDNIRMRIANAVTGKLTAIHSPPCFTKRGGYKFCTRVYLNGDGMGKTTHISVFFVIMKSDFDNLSAWPFPHRVSFKLLNPKNEKLSHRETFIPDKNSSSFQKPVRDMNVAAGCPMFVRLDRLHSENFIVDDCLFIETTVGT